MNLSQTLKELREANVACIVFGPPGCGKSAAAKEAAGEDQLIDLRLSMVDPLDLRGLPMPTDSGIKWSRPDFLPSEGKGVLLLDELNTAQPSVMNAALQLVLDRRCGPHILPKDWWVMACCNRAEDKAAVISLPSPLLNRFVVLQYEPEIKEWSNWAIKNNINEDVIGFLNFREPLLYQPPSANEYANFPTPRSWATVSKMLNVGLTTCVSGAIGEGAAIEFDAYVKAKKDLPDLESLMNDEHIEELKIKPSVAYAVTVGLAFKCIKTPEKISKGMKVARLLSPELTALFISLLLAAVPTQVIRNPVVVKWMTENKYLLT